MNRNNALQTTHQQSQALQIRADSIIKTYGDSMQFTNTFAPVKTEIYSRFPFRCVNGTAPTVYDLELAYGKNYSVQWLATHIVALSEYCGAKHKVTEFQLSKLANILRSEYGHLKVTEFMLFFHLIEAGKLGRLEYGTFDPIRVTEMMLDFLPIRANYIEQHEQEEREKREAEHAKRAIPRPDFLKKVYTKFGVPEIVGFSK